MVFQKRGFLATAYEQVFLWLMSDGPVYGYELASRFEKLTKGHMKVSYGTVYPFLRRMEKRGLISSKRDEASGRVYYELAAKGKAASEKLSGTLRESKADFDEKLLGYLAIYSQVFGRDALNEIFRRAKSSSS